MFLPLGFVAHHDDYLILVSTYVALFFVTNIMFGQGYIPPLRMFIDVDSFAMVFISR